MSKRKASYVIIYALLTAALVTFLIAKVETDLDIAHGAKSAEKSNSDNPSTVRSVRTTTPLAASSASNSSLMQKFQRQALELNTNLKLAKTSSDKKQCINDFFQSVDRLNEVEAANMTDEYRDYVAEVLALLSDIVQMPDYKPDTCRDMQRSLLKSYDTKESATSFDPSFTVAWDILLQLC